MLTYYDSNGTPYVLSAEIGRGGEGTVFYCPHDPSLVAKIYHEPISPEKEEKLRWMAANRNDYLLKVAAWILETLHDKEGRTVGFLMPNVKAKEIHELYSLKSRRVHFPEATWPFLLHTAANVARAFYVLHKNDHIMGDVNHGNCVVLADGTVKLIDCDSYSIKTDKGRYPCEVGVATHLAPELQGRDLGEIEREKKHDNFGLAVILFQLLFLGRHPFAGNYLGYEDKSLEDCIRERRFAYGNEDITGVKQPPGTLSLSQVSTRVAMMFERAFMMDDRPEPREWIEALEDLSSSLKQCAAHIGHHYFQELTSCPWCELESKTGLMLFPFVSSDSNSEKEFNIFTIENLLASLDIPKNLPAKPSRPAVLPPPSPEALELGAEHRNRLLGFAAFELIIVFFISLAAAPSCGFILGIVALAMFLSVRYILIDSDKERLQLELQDARAGWDYLEDEWKNYRKDKDFVLDIVTVRQKIADYHSLHQEKHNQVKSLSETSFSHQLEGYLANFKVADAGLRGIEDEHLEVFSRFGIETAADFDEPRLKALLALDEKTKKLLLRWRRKLENKFVFDPDASLPEPVKNRFEIEFTESRRKVEKEIEQLLVALRSGSKVLREQQKQLLSRAEAVTQKLLQAESDFSRVNNTALMTVVLVMVPIFVPIGVSILQEISYAYVGVTKKQVTPPPPKLLDIVSQPVPSIEIPMDANFKVNEKITDKELAGMSHDERVKSAKALHQQARKLIEQKDFKDAEKKLRLAVRFIDYDIRILFTLGDLLYEQKKHDDSITFLKKALIINSYNQEVKILLGANYLKLDDAGEAERIFREVLEQNPDSFAANYNLGLIEKNKSDFGSATKRFYKAVAIEPGDVDAQYELGVCLYNTGDRAGAESQYWTLQRMDKRRAERLRKLIGLETMISSKP
jgi:DNA-binding helix-hairpin-helix protein with protein kinase domain/Flp pilus assembly protein TadD